MCGRFRLEVSPKDIIGFYKLIEELDRKYKGGMEVFNLANGGQDYYPSSKVPIISSKGPEKVTWGFPMDKKLLINGRSEGIFTKPYFNKMLENGRCLIAASSFYEWNLGRKYTIKNENKYFFMAGLKGTIIDEKGEKQDRMLIITTKANKDMERIHPRMPVILDNSSILDYLNPKASREEIQSLLKPWNGELIIDLSLGEQISFFDL